MKTNKLSIDAAQLCQNQEDKKSFFPVTLYKNTGNTGGKIYPEKKDI